MKVKCSSTIFCAPGQYLSCTSYIDDRYFFAVGSYLDTTIINNINTTIDTNAGDHSK